MKKKIIQIASARRRSAARTASAKNPDSVDAIRRMPAPRADVARRMAATQRAAMPSQVAVAQRSKSPTPH